MVDAHNKRVSGPAIKQTLTTAAPPVVKKSLTTESPLEAQFLSLWTAADGPALEREVPLIPGRLFRVDFLHRASKTVIEIEGYGPGHASKKSFKKDGDKYFMLDLDLGYHVIRLTKSLITEENVRKVIAMVTKNLLASGRE